MFTCDWCQQEYEGIPTLLTTTGLRLLDESKHECVCQTCADLANSEESIVGLLVLGSRLLYEDVTSAAA